MIKEKLFIGFIALFLIMAIGCRNKDSKEITKNLTVTKASALIKSGAKVLDVRTAPEFQAGHIPGAIQINVLDSSFEAKILKLSASNQYIVHCAANAPKGRAAKAMKMLKKKGFINLYSLSGGYQAWVKSGMPTE